MSTWSPKKGPPAAYWYFVEDPELHLAAQAEAVEVSAERTGSGFSVRVSASSLVKDLTLFPDRLDPESRRRYGTGDPAGRPEPHLPGDF